MDISSGGLIDTKGVSSVTTFNAIGEHLRALDVGVISQEVRGLLTVAEVLPSAQTTTLKLCAYPVRSRIALSRVSLRVDWSSGLNDVSSPRHGRGARTLMNDANEQLELTSYDSSEPSDENTFSGVDVIRILRLCATLRAVTSDMAFYDHYRSLLDQ